MSLIESGDEQSEDGELRQSPSDVTANSDGNNFSSEDEAEIVDTLDIKPPQARIILPTRTKHHGTKSRRKRCERQDLHREKHHRSRHREKIRHYREQITTYPELQYVKDSKDGTSSSRHTERHEMRYVEKQHRKERFVDDKSIADKELEDLRERLLSKRTKGDDTYTKIEKSETHKERGRQREVGSDAVLEGESGTYIKEIINMNTSGDEKKHKKHEKVKEDEKLTEEERAEQDLRREKLLEAEREMARLKEQSRIERERRHLEKQAKRKLEEEENLNKRLRAEENVVMVSDNSDNDVELNEDIEINENEQNDVSDVDNKSYHSNSSGEHSDHRSRSYSVETDYRSRSRSGTNSPKDNGNISDNVEHEEEPIKKVELDEQLPPYFPAIQGCRSVEEFQCLNRIEEGTYGVVYRARDKRTEEIVALKRLKMEKEKEGFPITSLREINTLLKGQHPNIVTVREIVVGSNMDKIFIVMDYVEHDLKSLMETMRHKKQSFTAGEIKCLIKQLLQAVAHLHDNWILHRDLKTSNLLLSHKGILKVGDFGLAREYGSPLKPYTPIVVTLWYRAPELLLCTKEYSTPIDMWSVGCIFGELLLMNPIFPGKSEIDQLNRVFKDLGTPNEKVWPGFNKLPAVQKMKFTEYPVSNIRSRFHMLTELGLLQLQKFLTFDPQQRATAEDALQHPYFSETPLPIDPSMFPTWPAKSELGHRRALAASPKPPSGGCEYKQLGGDEDSYGFRISGTVTENRRIHMGGGFSLKF